MCNSKTVRNGLLLAIYVFSYSCSIARSDSTKTYYAWDDDLKDFKAVNISVSSSAPCLEPNFYTNFELPVAADKPQWFKSQIGNNTTIFF